MHRVRPVLYSGCLLGLLLCSAVVCEADLPQKPSDLSVRQLIALAYEYSWHEDPWTERALLEQAAARPPGADTARAKALLAECYFVSGQTQDGSAGRGAGGEEGHQQHVGLVVVLCRLTRRDHLG